MRRKETENERETAAESEIDRNKERNDRDREKREDNWFVKECMLIRLFFNQSLASLPQTQVDLFYSTPIEHLPLYTTSVP